MRVLIIGIGIAGSSVAGALRDLEPDSGRLSIDIISRESCADPEIYGPGWYEARRIRVRKNCEVVRLDRAKRRIILRYGEEAGYDNLVLCMGADSARPPIPNSSLEGIFTIREYGDSEALHRQLQAAASQVVVLGGGLRGLEAAHHLLSPGQRQLAIVEQAPNLLPRLVDEMCAAMLQRLIERWPCEVLVGTSVAEFLGRGQVEGVRLTNGLELAAQTVLVSTGIRPRVDLAREAGLEVNRGIIVEACLRSSDPNIFVAGDLVEFEGVVCGTIPAALGHAPVVAHNLLKAEGELLYHQTVPESGLKIDGIELTSIGKVVLDGERGYEVVRRYDNQRECYEKWVFREGRLVGCLLLGSGANRDFARASIGQELDPAVALSLPRLAMRAVSEERQPLPAS